MNPWVERMVTILATVLACGGFWTFMQAWVEKRSAKTQMILGLGHDRIIFLCMKYIERGWISKDEYEDLNKYLYGPYEKMGGNGTAQRVFNEVKKLPIKKITYQQQAEMVANGANPDTVVSNAAEDPHWY